MNVLADSVLEQHFRLAGDVLNCLGKTIKNSDAWTINSLLIYGQRYLRQV